MQLSKKQKEPAEKENSGSKVRLVQFDEPLI